MYQMPTKRKIKKITKTIETTRIYINSVCMCHVTQRRTFEHISRTFERRPGNKIHIYRVCDERRAARIKTTLEMFSRSFQ